MTDNYYMLYFAYVPSWSLQVKLRKCLLFVHRPVLTFLLSPKLLKKTLLMAEDSLLLVLVSLLMAEDSPRTAYRGQPRTSTGGNAGAVNRGRQQ